MKQKFTFILTDQETQVLLNLIGASTLQFQVTKQLFDSLAKQIADQQAKAQAQTAKPQVVEAEVVS